jgi:hypothetical protein
VSEIERDTAEEVPPEEQHMGVTRLARRVFVWFIITFALARSTVLLMNYGRLHDFYLRFGQTHVHHLNYGIILLAGVGGYLLFLRHDDRGLARAAILYGVGLALTFDEFGMWLHLDDVYWQRASFDAMVLVAAILGLIMAAPTVRRFRLRHWIWTLVMAVAVIWFTSLLMKPFQRMHDRIAPWFRRMDQPAVTDTTVGADSAGAGPAAAQPPAGPSQRIRK